MWKEREGETADVFNVSLGSRCRETIISNVNLHVLKGAYWVADVPDTLYETS